MPKITMGRFRFGGRRAGKSRGAALIEMTFVLVILVTLMLGVIQYGMIISTLNTLSQLSREGARYAAIHSTESTADSADTVTGSIRWYIKSACGNTEVKYTDLTSVGISPSLASRQATGLGTVVTITINYDMTKKFFLPTSFPGLSHMMSGSTAPVSKKCAMMMTGAVEPHTN